MGHKLETCGKTTSNKKNSPGDSSVQFDPGIKSKPGRIMRGGCNHGDLVTDEISRKPSVLQQKCGINLNCPMTIDQEVTNKTQFMTCKAELKQTNPMTHGVASDCSPGGIVAAKDLSAEFTENAWCDSSGDMSAINVCRVVQWQDNMEAAVH